MPSRQSLDSRLKRKRSLQELLGHQWLSTTSGYIHVRSDHVERAWLSANQRVAARFEAIRALLPAALRAAVQAGPIEEDQWCLLVSSNAVAAKLRQFVPALQMHLEARGLPVAGIRIKVQGRSL